MKSLVSRLLLASLGLASMVPPAQAASELAKIKLYALTKSHQLIAISADQPGKIIRSVTLSGLADDEHVLGIDYRVAYGTLFALGSSGRIFTVDVERGALTPVGDARFGLKLEGERVGFDFNPAADRIRIVTDRGQNLRAHPETGALIDFKPDETGLQPDGALTYAAGDTHAGMAPRIIAAAYTYNTENEKLTTNFAIDAAQGSLVRQGSTEGQQPVVSPNSGQLSTIGALGIGTIVDAHFDIADVTNTALAAIQTAGVAAPTLYRIDLASGEAEPLGVIGTGEALRGLAIEP